MTVYEVIGWTAKIDWAARSEQIALELFSTEEKAVAFITEMKMKPNWRMDWDSFCYIKRKVK